MWWLNKVTVLKTKSSIKILQIILTSSHTASSSIGGVACFSILLKADSFRFILRASSFSLSRSRASAFSSSYIKRNAHNHSMKRGTALTSNAVNVFLSSNTSHLSHQVHSSFPPVTINLCEWLVTMYTLLSCCNFITLYIVMAQDNLRHFRLI